MSHSSKRPARFAWQIAVAFLLILALLSLAIPTVRASLSAWLGLSVAPSNQMPASAVTLVAVTPPAASPLPAIAPTLPQASLAPTAILTSTPAVPVFSGEKPAAISQLSPQAGWNLLAPSHLPEGYKFESAYLDTNHQMVILTYMITRPLPGAKDPSLTASESITILQAQKNDFVPMQIAPSASVKDVQVNGQPAAYVVGAWDTEFVKDDKDPNGGKMVSTWRNDLQVKNLYWHAGGVYLAIVTNDGIVTQQDMLDMAASFGR